MLLCSLLGKQLKDDEVVEVLEFHEIEVIYDFDRTHENIEDVYWAGAKTHGFQLRFNERQVLDTIFCYIAPSEGFTSISPELIGVPLYETFDAAEEAIKSMGCTFLASDASKGPKFNKWWIRADVEGVRRHYQFRDGLLFRVTLSLLPK